MHAWLLTLDPEAACDDKPHATNSPAHNSSARTTLQRADEYDTNVA